MFVSSQETELSSICVSGVSILPLSTICRLDYGSVSNSVVRLVLCFILSNKQKKQNVTTTIPSERERERERDATFATNAEYPGLKR